MALILSDSVIGAPDWEQIPVGDPTSTLTQWLNLRTKRWEPVGWFTEDGRTYLCRFENNYRRPVTLRAKIDAIWAARVKIFKRYVLMQTYSKQLNNILLVKNKK